MSDWPLAETIAAWSREELDRLLEGRLLWDGPFERTWTGVDGAEDRQQWYAYVASEREAA